VQKLEAYKKNIMGCETEKQTLHSSLVVFFNFSKCGHYALCSTLIYKPPLSTKWKLFQKRNRTIPAKQLKDLDTIKNAYFKIYFSI
jgi:hypothetical protein